MVEALVCAQDWLRGSNGIIMIDDTILEMENMEESLWKITILTHIVIIFYVCSLKNMLSYIIYLKDLATEQPTIVIDEMVEDTS